MKQRTVLDAGAGALADYYDWQHDAHHGDVVVYWIGDLQTERQYMGQADDPQFERKMLRSMVANSLADRILADQKKGIVTLLQKRLGDHQYEYWAVRLGQPGGGTGCQKVVEPNASLCLV